MGADMRNILNIRNRMANARVTAAIAVVLLCSFAGVRAASIVERSTAAATAATRSTVAAAAAPPLISCPAGYYCIPGSASAPPTAPIPCPAGTYSNATTIAAVRSTQPRSSAGAAANSDMSATALALASQCTACDAGQYCNAIGATHTTGPCAAGYYCLRGSTTPTPGGVDAATAAMGGRCRPGGFCPRGSSAPTPCPAGTFNNVTGATAVGDCWPCPPGYSCAEVSPSTDSSNGDGAFELNADADSADGDSGDDSSEVETVPAINPKSVYCLAAGGVVMFDTSNGNFPVYQSPHSYSHPQHTATAADSDAFDATAFHALAVRLRNDPKSVSVFAYTFTVPGTYVFANNMNPYRRIVILVHPIGQSHCISTFSPLVHGSVPNPHDDGVSELKNLHTSAINNGAAPGSSTSTRLRSVTILEVGVDGSLVVTPDVKLIVTVVVLVAFLLSMGLLYIHYFSNHNWEKRKAKPVGYKASAKNAVLFKFATKGTVKKIDLESKGLRPMQSALIPGVHDGPEAIKLAAQAEEEVIRAKHKELVALQEKAAGGKSTSPTSAAAAGADGKPAPKKILKKSGTAKPGADEKGGLLAAPGDGVASVRASKSAAGSVDAGTGSVKSKKGKAGAITSPRTGAAAAGGAAAGGAGANAPVGVDGKMKGPIKVLDDGKTPNELLDEFDLEGFDMHSLYQMVSDTAATVNDHFEKQESSLNDFYQRMALETEIIKSMLSVKMHVQLDKTQEGVQQAIASLVGAEVNARLHFNEMWVRRENEFHDIITDMRTTIKSLTDDWNYYPVKELVRQAITSVQGMHKAVSLERMRRRVFPQHVDLVGVLTVTCLRECDTIEWAAKELYLGQIELFRDKIQTICNKTLAAIEQQYATQREKLKDSAEKIKERLKAEHLMLVYNQIRQIDNQVFYLQSRMKHPPPGTIALVRRADAQVGELMQRAVTHMGERIHQTMDNQAPSLFRGINPSLALVLSNLMSMHKFGTMIDPTGHMVPKDEWDVRRDPFAQIIDPGELSAEEVAQNAAAEREQVERDAAEAEQKRRQIEDGTYVDPDVQRHELEKEAARLDTLRREMDGERKRIFEERERQHAAAIEALNKEREAINSNPSLTDAQRATALARVDEREKAINTTMDDARSYDMIMSSINTDILNVAGDGEMFLDDKLAAQEALLAQAKQVSELYRSTDVAKNDELREHLTQTYDITIADLNEYAEQHGGALSPDDELRLRDAQDGKARVERLMLAKQHHEDSLAALEVTKQEIGDNKSPIGSAVDPEAARHALQVEADRLTKMRELTIPLVDLDKKVADDDDAGRPPGTGGRRGGIGGDETERERGTRGIIDAAFGGEEAAAVNPDVKVADDKKMLDDLAEKQLSEAMADFDRREAAIRADTKLTDAEKEAKLAELRAQRDALRQMFTAEFSKLFSIWKQSVNERETELKRQIEELRALDTQAADLRASVVEDEQSDDKNLAILTQQAMQEITDRIQVTGMVPQKNEIPLLDEYDIRLNDWKDDEESRKKEIADQIREQQAQRRQKKNADRMSRLKGIESLKKSKEENVKALKKELDDNKSSSAAGAPAAAGGAVPTSPTAAGGLAGVMAAAAAALLLDTKADRERLLLTEDERAAQAVRERNREWDRKLTFAADEAADHALWESRADIAEDQTREEAERLHRIEVQKRIDAARGDGHDQAAAVAKLKAGFEGTLGSLNNQMAMERDKQDKKRKELQAKRRLALEQQRLKEQAMSEDEKRELMIREAELARELLDIRKALDEIDPPEARRDRSRPIIMRVMAPRTAREIQAQSAKQSSEILNYGRALIKDEPDSKKWPALKEAKFGKAHQKEMLNLARRHHNEMKGHYAALYPDSAEAEFAAHAAEWTFAEAEDLEDVIKRRKDELDAQAKKARDDAQKRIEALEAQKETERKATEERIKAQEEQLTLELERREKALAESAALQTKKRLDAEEKSRKQRAIGAEEKELIMTQFKTEQLKAETDTKSEVARQNKRFIEKRRKQLHEIYQKTQKQKAEQKKKEQAQRDTALQEGILGTKKSDSKSDAKPKTADGKSDSKVVARPRIGKARPVAAGRVRTAGTSGGATTRREAKDAGGDDDAGSVVDDDGGDTSRNADDIRASRRDREQREKEDRKQKRAIETRLDRLLEAVKQLDERTDKHRAELYRDTRDEALVPDQRTDEVRYCAPDQLSTREFVLYSYGQNIIKLLQRAFPERGQRPVTLLVAHGLPVNPHQQTAFRNSFIHRRLPNASADVLFVRRERLSDVGDFILLLIHSLAHIQTSVNTKEWDDRNKVFVAQFFKCLKAVCADLFHSHTSAPSAAGVDPLSTQVRPPTLSTLSGQAATVLRLLQSTSVVPIASTDLASINAAAADAKAGAESKEEEPSVPTHAGAGLTNASVAAWRALYNAPRAGLISTDDSYSVISLQKRLQSYTAFSASTALRSHLNTIETDVAMNDELRAALGITTIRPAMFKGGKMPAPPPVAREKDMSFTVNGAGSTDQSSDAELIEELTDQANAEAMQNLEVLQDCNEQLTVWLQMKAQNDAMHASAAKAGVANAASARTERTDAKIIRELRAKIHDLTVAQEAANSKLAALQKMSGAAAASAVASGGATAVAGDAAGDSAADVKSN